MPCVGDHASTGFQIHDRKPDGNKKILVVSFADLLIDVMQNLCRAAAQQRTVFYQRFGYYHEQRCRNPFAGDICHNQGQMILIHKEEVVEISPNLFGRIHGSVNIAVSPVRECGKSARQHIRLDFFRNVEFRADPLPLRCSRGNLQHILLDPLNHAAEGL